MKLTNEEKRSVAKQALLRVLKASEKPLTYVAIASKLGITKPTAIAWIARLRKEGVKISTKLCRQGDRGPRARAYALV